MKQITAQKVQKMCTQAENAGPPPKTIEEVREVLSKMKSFWIKREKMAE